MADKKLINSSELRNLPNNSVLDNYQITGDIWIINEFRSRLIFQNCIINNDINIVSIQSLQNIIFKNCVFHGDVIIRSTYIEKDLQIIKCVSHKKLLINDVSVPQIKILDGEYNEIKFSGYINDDKSLNGKILIDEGVYGKILFEKVIIYSEIVIERGQFDSVSFYRTKLNEGLTLSHNEQIISSLSMNSAEFFDRVDLRTSKITGWCYISEVVFNGKLIVKKEFFAESFYLVNVVSRQAIAIDFNGGFSNMNISDCRFENGFDCSFSNYSFDDKIIVQDSDNHLTCTLSGTIQGNIRFKNIYIQTINVNCINLGNIFFDNVYSAFITIQDFHNKGKLTFNDLKFVWNYNILIIFDSSIGDTEFINLDFRKLQEIVIAKSDVSSLSLSNSNFPKFIQIKSKAPKLGYQVNPQENISDNLYFRESYRQLKSAMEKQGNSYAALWYKSLEMNFLRKELKFGWEKILLLLNFISNKHGISWSRGILFTFSISVIFFFLYNLSMVNPYFVFKANSSYLETRIAVKEALNKYFEYISTFPSFNFDKHESSWKLNLTILLSRIFIGYGIYQTIVAFRKYGK